MKDYKNPALSNVNGVLTGHCIHCGRYIGNEYDTSFYTLIRRKYCTKCAAENDRITKEIGRKNYREKTKRTVKTMAACIDQYQKQTVIMKEYIAELERQLEDLKRSNVR